MVILKRILVEGVNPPSYTFNFRYVESGRISLFEKVIEKITVNNFENDLKYYITETETLAGYLSAAYHNEEWPMKEISRKEISREELDKMFEK